jgi:hypothetical protein
MGLLAVPISSTAASVRKVTCRPTGPPPRTRQPARPDPPVEHPLPDPLTSVNSVNSSLMIYHSWGSGDTRRRLSFREPNA